MGESPRWHKNRLWFSDWGAQEIVAVDLDGNREVVFRTAFDICVQVRAIENISRCSRFFRSSGFGALHGS